MDVEASWVGSGLNFKPEPCVSANHFGHHLFCIIVLGSRKSFEMSAPWLNTPLEDVIETNNECCSDTLKLLKLLKRCSNHPHSTHHLLLFSGLEL